jgi:hypothetical protein
VPPTQEVRKRRPQLSPALHVVGKCPQRRLKLVASTGGRLIFLRDRISGQSFLADTGATYSVLPHRSNAPLSGPNLVAPDGAFNPSNFNLGTIFLPSNFYWRMWLNPFWALIFFVKIICWWTPLPTGCCLPIP